MIYILIVIVILLISYMLMIMPSLNKKRIKKMEPFEEVYLTHRGLFNNKDIPENSIKAFKETVNNNFGTELDVQMTTDGKLVVFHDSSLLRMCNVDKKITDCSYEELLQYHLLDTDEKIPLFEDVLNILKDDTPLVIEIKPEGDCIKTCEKTVEMMRKYHKRYTMESFNPLVVYYLKKNHPDIIRGQLAYNMFKDSNCMTKNILLKFICSNYLGNFITKPDYCAYDIRTCSNISFRIISKIYKGECVAWTCKSEDDLILARKYYRQFIFDSFYPISNIKEGENI